MTTAAPSVVLLGVDGSGKTTQAGLLVERLQAEGTVSICYTRSAGVDVARHTVSERVALAATAAQRIGDSQREAAIRGAVWVADRYADCHLAVDALSPTRCPDLVASALSALSRPTLTLWLDLDPEVARGRILRRGYDEESLEHLIALRDAYLALGAASNYRHVPADGTPDEVHVRVWQAFTAVARATA